MGKADIRLLAGQNSETIFEDIAPDSVTEYISVDPGTHSFELSNSDNSIVFDTVDVDLSDLAGQTVSGVIVPIGTSEVASAMPQSCSTCWTGSVCRARSK